MTTDTAGSDPQTSTDPVFVFTRHGGPETMEFIQRETPTAQEGELLIAVKAASVNPFDSKYREGQTGPKKFDPPQPMGMDLAGEVLAVGEEVEGFSVGDRVVARSGFGMRSGALSPRTIVDAKNAAALPEAVPFEQAAEAYDLLENGRPAGKVIVEL